MPSSFLRVATCGLALAFLASETAKAQSDTPDIPTAPEVSPAEALIQQGIDARRNGDDGRAVALFGQAYDLEPSGRAAAQLGLAEQGLGRFSDAHAHLTEALASAHPWVGENREALEGALRVVEQNVGRLEVLGGVTGARLLSDGVEVGVFPLDDAIVLEVGSHAIEVLADGYYPFSRNVDVRSNELSRLSIELRVRLEEAAQPADQELETVPREAVSAPEPVVIERGPNTRGAGIALLSLGLLSAAGGVVGTVLRESAASEWNDDDVCLQGGLTREENCGDKKTRAERAGVASGVLYGVGGAMVLVGAILIAVDGGDDEPEQALRPRCAPGFASLQCEMSF